MRILTNCYGLNGSFIGLDSYILNIFSHLEPIWIYINNYMTSLLKLEIIVCFLTFIASLFRVTEEERLSENRSV